MRYKQQTPIWPLLCMLTCLFVLSLTSPRSWERIARDQPVATVAVTEHGPENSSSTQPVVSRFTQGMPTLADPPAIYAPRDTAFSTSVPLVARIESQPAIGDLQLAGPRIDVALRPEIVKPELDVPAAHVNPTPVFKPDPPMVSKSSDTLWQEPQQMLRRLEQLSASDVSGHWATNVIGRLHELAHQGEVSSGQTAETFAELRSAGERVENLVSQVGEGSEATQLRRIGHALSRRLDLWELAGRYESVGRALTDRGCPDSAQLALCLNDVETLTDSGSEATGWRRYVLLDALDELSGADDFTSSATQRDLARRVLRRLNATRLTTDQRQFLSDGPLAALAVELRHWAAEPVSLNQLAMRIEQYERTGLASHARDVAADMRRLVWSPSAETRQLGRHLDSHYRNCNVRAAVNERLLNRLLENPAPRDQATSETILGVTARGHAHTTTELSIRFVPDDRRLLMSLDAVGQITSSTTSSQSVATLYNRGVSDYEVHKRLEIRPDGMHGQRAVAQAHTTVQLRDLKTTLDFIPLVGWFVRDRAQRQYTELRPLAQRETERKIATRLEQQFDEQADARIRNTNQRIKDGALATLSRLSLDTSLMEMRTTEQRLIVRARLAGDAQLGAHTPRPRAPSDSLLSVQVHESAINNVLERLELDGQTFTLAQLHERLAERLNRPIPEKIRRDVTLMFAKTDAIQVRCQDNRVRLTLSLASLAKGETEWRDFTVRVNYKPDPTAADGRLVRDGVVQLSAQKRLGAKGQVALRGVFSKMFSKQRHWQLVPESIATHPRLQDVEVVQFVIDDGWIGLAIAPKRQVPPETFAKR